MEKKTKKMTKAEAFEYLKGKRVLCGAYSTEIQDFAKSVGFYWSSCKDEYWLVLALFFGKDGRLTYTLSPKEFESRDDYEEMSADDILSIEIVEEENGLDKDCAMSHAMEIMRWLREKSSPHTTMIIDVNHVELLEGIEVTADMLKRIGFEEHKGICPKTFYRYWDKEYRYKLDVDYDFCNSDRKWSIHIDNGDCDTIGSGEFTYVHELQNLTRVVSGFDLPITKEMLYGLGNES